MKKSTIISLLFVLLFIGKSMVSTAQNNPAPDQAQTTPCGDANMDGNVNVLDIITMVNHIMGSNPTPFSFAAADVNVSGSVDVLDIISVINMIMQVPGLACPCSPIVIDNDGNNYGTIKIGEQCWMKENLKTTKYRDGTNIEYPGSNNTAWENNTTGAYAWYNNDIAWKDLYGALYNGHAVFNANGLCPTGWHVPTTPEWAQLTNFAGGESVAGGKLKSTRTAPTAHPRWDSPNVGATDQYGFAALPGGYRTYTGTFVYMGDDADWWTATLQYGWAAHIIEISSDWVDVFPNISALEDGLSVRCMRDYAGQVTAPEVITTPATNVSSFSTTVGGNVISDGGAQITDRGIYWGTDANPRLSGGYLSLGNGTGAFLGSLSGLASNTIYYFIATATNIAGTAYGETRSFTTLSSTFTCSTSTIEDIDGNTYNTVLIGTQCWMKENLKTTRYHNGPSIAYPGSDNTA
ncbi:MAG: FISUMP domain-containing protein [Bacteroidales bacterium]|nr:FISUMP domain-containing protein [Bacteroidales bacterium]MDZ4203181.1 FISUMP domain-containing protein [Bacteroidales bacterium]